jgi:hypothetical protein
VTCRVCCISAGSVCCYRHVACDCWCLMRILRYQCETGKKVLAARKKWHSTSHEDALASCILLWRFLSDRFAGLSIFKCFPVAFTRRDQRTGCCVYVGQMLASCSHHGRPLRQAAWLLQCWHNGCALRTSSGVRPVLSDLGALCSAQLCKRIAHVMLHCCLWVVR